MTRGQIYAGKAVILIKATDLTTTTLRSVENKFKRMSNTLGALGRTAFTGGFLSSAGQGLLLRRFAKYDDLMLELRVKMGLLNKVTRQQEQEFAALEKRIRQLGKSTSYTTQEVAEGAIRLAQAGLTGKEIRNSLNAVLDLARGTRTELGDAARVMANTMRTFNLESEQANAIVSEFVVAARMGTVELDDLAESLKYSSSTAVELGQSLAGVLAIFTVLSERGMRGSIAGTSLNTALANTAKKAQDIADKYDFEVPTDMAGNLKFVDFLRQLDKATRNMGSLDRIAAFQDLFNLRGGRAIVPIADEAMIQRLVELSNQIASAGDEARQAAQVMDSGLGGAARRATSALEDLNITLGKIQKGPLTSLLNAIPPVANALSVLMERNQGLVLTLAAIPVAMVAAGAGLLTFSFTLRKVAGLIGLVRIGLSSLGNFAAKGLIPTAAVGASRAGRAISPGIAAAASKIGKYPTGAASAVPGIIRSQKAAALLNARLAPQAALYEATMTTSASHAAQQYQIYRRNKHFAKLGGPNAAAHAQRAATAKQAFKTAQANKKAASIGLTGIKARMAPITMRAAPKVGILSQVFNAVGRSGNVAKSLGRITAGFLKFGWAIGKFATKTNVLMIALQVILMFGNKIPYIAPVLERIGSAFGKFFSVLGTLGTRLGPVFSLMKTSMGLLSNQETAGLGVSGMVKSLQGMASIVGNTLVEAWGRFRVELGYVYETIVKTVAVVWELGKALFTIVTNVIGNVIGSIVGAVGSRLEGFMGMFEGGGGGFVEKFKQGLVIFANAVMGLVNWGGFFIMKLNNMLWDFTDNMHIMLLEVVGQAARIFGGIFGSFTDTTGVPIETIKQQKAARNVRFRRATRDNDQVVQDAMANIISALQSTHTVAAGQSADAAQQRVAQTMGDLTNYMRQLVMQANGLGQQSPQGQAGGGGVGQIQGPLAPPPMAQVQQWRGFVAALVGTAVGTRGNVLRNITETELQKQTSILEDIRNNTEGMRNPAFS